MRFLLNVRTGQILLTAQRLTRIWHKKKDWDMSLELRDLPIEIICLS